MYSLLDYDPKELKENIEQKILEDERIKNNKAIYEKAKDILLKASEFMDVVETVYEVVFMYDNLSDRLYEAGKVCEKMRNPDLGEKLTLISEVITKVVDYLKEILEKYTRRSLTFNVDERALISRLWPHNCKNIENLMKVFYEYVVENAVLLGCDEGLVVDFLNEFDIKISKINDLISLWDIYMLIRDESNKNAKFRKETRKHAWQYGIISLVIEFMLSDFYHCYRQYNNNRVLKYNSKKNVEQWDSAIPEHDATR